MLRAMYASNSVAVWKKYVCGGGEVSEDEVYCLGRMSKTSQDYPTYESLVEEIFHRLARKKKPIAIIMDDFQNLVQKLEQKNKQEDEYLQSLWIQAHPCVNFVSEDSPLNEAPLLILVAASQHFGYQHLGGENVLNHVDYGTIPREPMDIYGELIRLVSASRGNTQCDLCSDEFEGILEHARLALSSSALILSPALHGISSAYFLREDFEILSTTDKELTITHAVLETTCKKIKEHLKKQNDRPFTGQNPHRNKELIRDYMSAWKGGEDVANNADYAILRDLGIMVRQRNKYAYISSVAQMMHLKELCSIDDYASTNSEVFRVSKSDHKNFETSIIMGIMSKGLPSKLMRTSNLAKPVDRIPKAGSYVNLKHHGFPSTGWFSVDMEKGQVVYLRNVLRAQSEVKGNVGIMVSDNFPAFDMFILSKDLETTKATLYGIQISTENPVKATRFMYSPIVFETMLKMLAIDGEVTVCRWKGKDRKEENKTEQKTKEETISDDSMTIEAGTSDDDWRTTAGVTKEFEKSIRTQGTAVAKIKLGYDTRNNDNHEAEVTLVHVYVGLADERVDKKIVTTVNTDAVLFLLGQEKIEDHFQIQLTSSTVGKR